MPASTKMAKTFMMGKRGWPAAQKRTTHNGMLNTTVAIPKKAMRGALLYTDINAQTNTHDTMPRMESWWTTISKA